MKLDQKRVLFLAGVALVGVFTLSGLFLRFVGNRYRGRIESVVIPQSNNEAVEVRRRVVRRVRIKNQKDEKGCIEVNPDGAVVVYSDCEAKTILSAERELDTKFIRRLFEHYALADLDEESRVMKSGYVVIVETDEGVSTYYVADAGDIRGKSGGATETISEIIANIIEDAPMPTPTAVSVTQTVTPTVAVGGVISTPTVVVNSSPTPNPTHEPQPFSCDFSESDPKKPYRVSQVVCTSEPTPAP